jgi:ankyrin repeat protein
LQQLQQQRPLIAVNPSQSPLFCLVWNRSWEELVRRCRRAKANEIFVQDSTTGNTLLHEACRVDPPPNVVAALRALSRVPNFQGATPLHMAASHRCSAGALKALLAEAAGAASDPSADHPHPQHHPTADLSSMGRAPIHYACMSFRGLDMDAFMLLLDETLRHGNRQFVPSLDDDGDMETRDDLDDDGSYLFDFDDNEMAVEEGEGEDAGKAATSALVRESDHVGAELPGDEQYYDPIVEDADLLVQGSSMHSRRGRHNHNSNHNGGGAAAVTVNVMSLKDAVGMTPLALLFRRYRQRVRTVISRIDQLHVHNPNLPSRAALVSAMTVHVELGELWEKARRIIAKLTQARLLTEQQEKLQQQQQETGGIAGRGGADLDPSHEHQFRTAAGWATEKHRRANGAAVSPDDVLPIPDADAEETDGESVGRDEAPPPPQSNNEAENVSSDDESHRVHTGGTTSTCPEAPAAARRQFRIVHASVGLVGYGCPPEMIRLAISLHPHQVREMDEDGNLPLHIAVQSSSYLTSSIGAAALGDSAANHNDWNNADPNNNMADDRSVRSAWSFFSTATISQTPHPFDKVIKILLQHYPEGAKTAQGRTGLLPLTLAVQHGNRTWQDGIRTLLNANPSALHSEKLFEPTLYPHVLATLGNAAGRPGDSSSLPLSSIGVVSTGTAAVVGAGGRNSGAVVGPTVNTATSTSPLLAHPLSSLSPPPPAISTVSSGSSAPQSSQQLRREACARYTFYEVLRTKPEWLTPEGRG